MYRQGLGDCFLVTLRREDGTPWRMLIDCGVILGTPDTTERLKEVIANLVADTGGRLDVLVITHEHYDHVAAFAAVPNLFCDDDAQRQPEQFQIGEVWFAWSEDPGDPLGSKLRKIYLRSKHSLGRQRRRSLNAGLTSGGRKLTQFQTRSPSVRRPELGALRTGRARE